MNKGEYIELLKEKVRKGYRKFLFDQLKPTTVKEIKQNEEELWKV